MVEDDIIERIRAANDIVDVVRQWVPLKKAGANFRGLCPFHQEKTPSFNVHPSKQIFHCFGCGEGGDVFAFVAKIQKTAFPETLRFLAERAGIDLPERGPSPQDLARRQENEALVRLLDLASAWFRRNLEESAEAEEARGYALKRGLDVAERERFQLGYAPRDGGALLRVANKKGFDNNALERAGLLIQNERGSYSRFRGRLMFPIQDAKGRLCGFGARILGAGEPKYLNSPEGPLFSKGRLLFAWPQAKEAITRSRRAILCEGYMDAIACHLAGVEQAVATLGTALTEDHTRQLKRYVDQVILVFDTDMAGVRAARRGCEVLLEAGLEPKVVSLDGAKDPDEFLKARGAEAFIKAVEEARDAIAFLAEAALKLALVAKAGEPLSLRERVGVLQDLFPVLARYATEMEAEAQLERAAGALSLSAEAVREDFRAYRRTPQAKRPTATVVPERAETEDAPDIKPNVVVKARKANALSKVERELLTLLIQHPSLLEEARESLPQPSFDDPADQLLGTWLWEHSGGAWLGQVDHKDPGVEDLLRELSLAGLELAASPQDYFRDLLSRRQERLLERRNEELRMNIAQAVGWEAQRPLLQEANQINSAIQEIRKERLKRDPNSQE